MHNRRFATILAILLAVLLLVPSLAVADAAPKKVVMWQQGWASPIEDPANQLVKAEIDRILGIDFSIIVAPPEGATERLNLLLSSDEQLDIVIGPLPNHKKAYADGAVAPLNDLLEKYGADIRRVIPADLWPLVTADDGQIIEIPNVTFGDQNYLAVRQDLLTKYGMETPKTLDEFEAFLAKAKEDMGNAPLFAPLSSNVSWGLYSTLRALGGMYFPDGYNSFSYDKDGNVISTARTAEYKEAIMKLADWYAKGYIPKDIFTWDSTKVDTAFAQGQIAARITWASVGFTPYAEGYLSEHPEAFYVYCDPIAGLKGNAGTYALGYSGGDWITAKSNSKDEAMQFLNWILADVDNYMLATYGVPGTHWEWVDKPNYVMKTLEAEQPYGASLYTFDVYGPMLRKEKPSLMDSQYALMFGQYASHVQNVPKNPFAGSGFGLFSALNEDYPVAEYDTFLNEGLARFFMGERSFDEWDAFIGEYTAMVSDYDAAVDAIWKEKRASVGGW